MGVNLTKISFIILSGAGVRLGFAQQPAGDRVAFQTQARLVMLPFHAARGGTNLADLSKSDVVLLEDGRPREFSIFDVPSGADRMPVELVLLFDANPPAGELWDPADVYQFVEQWNDSMSAALLQSGGAVRVSVYRCAGQKLYRSTPATSDRAILTAALRAVLTPLPSKPEQGSVTELTLPPKRAKVDLNSNWTDNYVTSNFAWADKRGWPLEAAIGLLDAMSAPSDGVSRVLVIFGQGIGATTTIPQDVGEHALDLGIPIYPVGINYEGLITPQSYPRNQFRMGQFEAIGKMTGGRAVEYRTINATLLQKILNEVKGHVLEQYVVGFAPDSNAPPRQHTLEVRPVAPASATIEGGKRRAVY